MGIEDVGEMGDKPAMPFLKISAVLTVHTEDAPQACEALNKAIDQLAIQEIPVFDSHVAEECVDPPEEAEDMRQVNGA